MNYEAAFLNLSPKGLRLPIKYHYRKLRGRLDREISYLHKLIGNGKRAIDIGANEGIYSYALSQICEIVEAFEPQPWCTETIIAYKKANKKNINVYNVGLSNSNGSLDLYIPYSSNSNSKLVTGLGSFREPEVNHRCIQVPVLKLDDYNFQDISIIKIDVEGYESQVIEGGKNTILREKPLIYIEIEQRHLKGKSINLIFEQIIELGYEGSFLLRDKIMPLSKFSYQEHQQNFLNNLYQEDYVNNFIFQSKKLSIW
ncbi:MAG: FkbM family methyltransferase [Potamolinea sp.]